MKEFIKKLIGRLEERKNHFGTLIVVGKDDLVLNYNLGKMHSFEDSIEIVNQFAEEYINCSTDTSTNTSSGWIPTSERLPEKNAIVLTCDKDGWISVKVNMPYAGVKNDFESGYYTAWMPLPEPFTPKEGRE